MERITWESGAVLRQIASGLNLVLGHPASVSELLGVLHGKTPSDTHMCTGVRSGKPKGIFGVKVIFKEIYSLPLDVESNQLVLHSSLMG